MTTRSAELLDLTSPLPPDIETRDLGRYGRLQCNAPLPFADAQRLDAALMRHPDTLLRLYPRTGRKHPDPAFLAALPALRCLWIEANAGDLVDLAPLSALPVALCELTLDTLAQGSDAGRDRPKRGLEALARLQALERLCLCGRLADLGFLRALTGLRQLSLWRTQLKSLAGIETCAALESLELHACGARDLAPLAALTRLASLEIESRSPLDGMEHLPGLAALRQLRLLGAGFKQPLLPLSALTALRVLVFDGPPTPQNLASIAAAPALRCLILPRSAGLRDAGDFEPLRGHPSLLELRIDSFDAALHARISDRFGWKLAYCNYPAPEYLAAD